MKTIGLLGGMSWESTVTYYQVINEEINRRLGNLNSGQILLYSVNFEEIEECQRSGNWDKTAAILGEAARRLEKAGADFIILCTNTMHKIMPQLRNAVSIPFIHIADAAAEKLKEKNIAKAAFLGTKYSMREDFCTGRIRDNGIEIIVPDEKEMEIINRIIFSELCRGIILESSKKEFLEIINELIKKGAQGVVLGCTEIGMLIKQEDVSVPVFDTALIHAQKAAEMAL